MPPPTFIQIQNWDEQTHQVDWEYFLKGSLLPTLLLTNLPAHTEAMPNTPPAQTQAQEVASKCQFLSPPNWLDYYSSQFWERLGIDPGCSTSVVDAIGTAANRQGFPIL